MIDGRNAPFFAVNAEETNMINQLKQMYADYQKKSLEVRQKAPIFAGMLGLGSDPRRHPCHEEFYDATIAWTEQFVKSNPTQGEAMEVASFMLEEPEKFRDKDSFWFLWVAVGNIRSIIPLLRKEDCKALAARFDELYKKKDRMPLQVETYKMLVKASK
jgi:hypothetical protein